MPLSFGASSCFSLTKVLIASDCKQVIQDINSGIGGGSYTSIMKEIIKTSAEFTSCSFIFEGWESNIVILVSFSILLDKLREHILEMHDNFFLTREFFLKHKISFFTYINIFQDTIFVRYLLFFRKVPHFMQFLKKTHAFTYPMIIKKINDALFWRNDEIFDKFVEHFQRNDEHLWQTRWTILDRRKTFF